ncbi:glycosyltransferase family 4 protein [Rhodococcus koreensis]
MRIDMPTRILDKHVGGNTTYGRNLQAGLRARGIEVGRISAGTGPVGTMLSESIAAVQKRESTTILHYVADTGPLVKVRGPSVVTVHGVASRWIDTARNNWQEMAWRTRVSRAIHCTSNIITVSNSSADDISNVFGVDREKINVINHGIDVAAYGKRQTFSGVVASSIPERYALYVGNIEPRKNLLELIKAFESKPLAGLPLLIAGKPAWNYSEILDSISKSTNVTYLGFVSETDRIALMQNCEIFVFPSLYEGFGFPVLEAMAAGAPVTCSRRGSLEEIAGPAGAIEALDSDAICDSVLRAVGDQQWIQRIRAEGPRWAKRFTWDESVDRHIDVYRRLVVG